MENRKPLLILMLCLCFSLAAGFAFGEVELRVDHPLIDLSETVRLSEFGETETETDTTAETAMTTKEEETPVTEEEWEPEGKTWIICVSEDAVTVNRVRVTGPDTMLKQLENVNKERDEIVLQDDYASYQSYRDVRDALTDAEIPFVEEILE